MDLNKVSQERDELSSQLNQVLERRDQMEEIKGLLEAMQRATPHITHYMYKRYPMYVKYPKIPQLVGDSCRVGADCCSGACSGGKPSTRVCKAGSGSTPPPVPTTPAPTPPVTQNSPEPILRFYRMSFLAEMVFVVY